MFENLLKIKNWKLKIAIVALSFFLWSDYANAAALIKPANTVGMVGWWRFDEGGGSAVADFSGQGNVGTLVDMEEADWVAGHVGTAIDLDGAATEHVVIDHDSSLSPTSAISMVAWIKPRTFGTGVATLVEKEYLTSYLWYLNGAGGDMIVNISGSDAESELSSIATDVWQHVAFTYDGLNVRFYVNSLPAGVSPLVGSIGTDTSDLQIGNDDTLVSPFDGYVDDVRIYNRILSQVEIRQIMEGDRIARYASTPDASGSLAQGLVGHWTLDGKDMNWGSGRVTDKSTQGNNGYVINMSTTSSPADGRLGQALSFDGTNDLIQATKNNLTSSFSVSMWLNISRGSSANRALMNGRGGSDGWGVGIGDADGEFRFTKSGVADLDFDTGNWLSGWNNYTWVVEDNYDVNLYVNGVFVGSYGDTQSIYENSSNDFTIGCDVSGVGVYNAFWNGLIDDVRIYNRVLSASEISKLYNSGKVTHDVSMSGGGVLENGLVSWWTFDGPDVNWGSGRVTDKSGQGNTGYVINMSTTSSPTSGKVGQALSFDGTNDRVYVPDQAAFHSNTNRTVSFWMNAATNTLFYSRIIAEVSDGSNSWEVIQGHNGSAASNALVLLNEVGGSSVTVNTPVGSILPNNLYHVVVLFDSTTATDVYINGISQTLTGNSFTSTHATGLSIGNRGDGNRPFLGIIDDVRIYNRALSASEVKQLYSGRR